MNEQPDDDPPETEEQFQERLSGVIEEVGQLACMRCNSDAMLMTLFGALMLEAARACGIETPDEFGEAMRQMAARSSWDHEPIFSFVDGEDGDNAEEVTPPSAARH